MRNEDQFGLSLLAMALVLGLSGCGTPGAPQPPSLNLPNRVFDLAAMRTGNQVSLTWTMPKRDTDKVLLKGTILAHLCREDAASTCVPLSPDVQFSPSSTGSFTETLPAAQASGDPRALTYFVELKNRNGRSAGLSNPAVVVAGAAPAAVTGFAAEVRKEGVVLHWANSGEQKPTGPEIRLHRKLLMSAPTTKPKTEQSLLAPQPETVEQNLLVDSCTKGRKNDTCNALDKEVRFGQSYEYRAQRVTRIAILGRISELGGEFSAPVRVEVKDIFPPAVPTEVAAVASAGETEVSIDLSWQPDTEADLAGYIVYRRDESGEWRRISGQQPIVGPAFHDSEVQNGKTYRYAVAAIDQGGHESGRSTEAQETVPTR